MSLESGYATPPDMYIPIQYSSFSDDESWSSTAAVSNSSEDTSNISNSDSDTASPEEDMKDCSPKPIQVAQIISKHKKPRKRSKPKNKPSKSEKDLENELLDKLISEQSSVIRVTNSAKTSPPPSAEKEALKAKLRSKRAAKKDPFGRFAPVEEPESVPAPITKMDQNLVRKTFPKFARQIDDRNPVHRMNTEKTRIDAKINALLKVYEARIARGELTVDEAMKRIFDLNHRDADELAHLKVDARNYYTSMTEDVIEYSMINTEHIEQMVKLREFERSLSSNDLNVSGWKYICDSVYSNFKDKNPLITDPEKFYVDVLKKYMSQTMLNVVKDMDTCGIFDKYPPEKGAMCMLVFQKHVSDIFPNMDAIVPMDVMIERNLLPINATTFNPFKGTLLAYGLFWSFSVHFNLFGAFFRTQDNGYGYYWVVYDRLDENIDGLIDPVLRKFDSKFELKNTSVEIDSSGNIVNTQHL